MMKKKPLACAIGTVLLGMSFPSLAQMDAQNDTGNAVAESELTSTAVVLDAETDTAALAESMAPAVEEVVVTGSRISKDVFSSSSPIDVISVETAQLQGLEDLGTLLQTTTVASGSPQVTAASSTAFVQNGGTGAQTISLRGLGANRTLVLLNGRRAGPAGVRGAVSSFDLNTIPLSAVERVEVLKDGASSVYGSDAVAGVVNIITDKGDSSSFNLFTSQPSESGGETTRADFTWANSTDKLRYRLTGDYYKREELAKGDRDYFSCGEQYIFSPSTGERRDVIDPRTGSPRCADLIWGHVWIYDYSGTVPNRAKAQYDYDGDLANYIPGFDAFYEGPNSMSTPPGWFPVAYDRTSDGVTNFDHPFQDAESLIPNTEIITLFGETSYDISDDHQIYAEALMSRRENEVNGYRQFWSYTYNENFFNGNAAPTAQGWTGAQWMSATPITDQNDSTVSIDYTRFVAGITGNLSEDWMYDASIQYSKSDAEYSNQRIFQGHMKANNWGSANGDGTCAGTTTNRGVPCMDLPWFDPRFLNGDFTPSEREFLFGWETGTTEYTQKSFEAFVSGPIMELPAGEMSVALGIHYRTDEIVDTPGPITLGGDAWGTSASGITQGKDRTNAIFAEIDIPLLEDVPLVKSLNLNASGRYTDVDSYGSDTTYKAGLNWEITDTVRLRAGHGTSFRSPALFELYLAGQTSFIGQRSVDPCLGWGAELDAGNISQELADNCAADGVAPDQAGTITATVFSGGGAGYLKAETSDTTTVGLIWSPEFADLKISADYFEINVEDEVGQLSAAQIVAGCYYSDSFPNDPLCRQFDRDPIMGHVDNIKASYINIAQQENRGWDLSIQYRTEIPWGELIVDTQHTFQIGDSYKLYTDSEDINTNGELGDPKWTGRLSATLLRGDWEYYYNVNIIGEADNYDGYGGNTASYRGEEVRVVLHADRVLYHTLSASYFFQDYETQVRFGITNLTDEKPPRVTTLGLGELSTMGNSAFYSQYNWVGRSFFFNVTKDL